jgi:hypothetical protein
MLPKDGLLFKMAVDAGGAQREAFFAVLRILGTQGQKWLKELPSSSKARIALQEARKGDFLTEADLYGQTNKTKGHFPQGRYLLVRPPDKQTSTVCALSCVWDFDGNEPDISCYLGIWTPRPVPIEEDDGAEKRPIVFLGYRFETPDAQGTKHKFFHSQPSRSMDRERRDLPRAVHHHSGMPTLQLDAAQPADLLVNMAISLHGRDYVAELFTDVVKLSPPRAPAEYVERIKLWF